MGCWHRLGSALPGKPGTPRPPKKNTAALGQLKPTAQPKLEDLRRKYALRIRTDLAALLAVRAPVRYILLRLIRKKEERAHTLHWNPVLKALDQPLCEHCSARAHPLYLCERVHLLCKDCWTQCAECSRFYCRLCQKQCKCGAGNAANGSIESFGWCSGGIGKPFAVTRDQSPRRAAGEVGLRGTT